MLLYGVAIFYFSVFCCLPSAFTNLFVILANPNHAYLGAPNNCQGINITGWEQLNNLMYLNSSKKKKVLDHCFWSIISLFPKKAC